MSQLTHLSRRQEFQFLAAAPTLFQPFFISGDRVADGQGGMVLSSGCYNMFNKPILDNSVAGKECPFFSDCPDGTSLLEVPHVKVAGVKSKPVFAVALSTPGIRRFFCAQASTSTSKQSRNVK